MKISSVKHAIFSYGLATRSFCGAINLIECIQTKHTFLGGCLQVPSEKSPEPSQGCPARPKSALVRIAEALASHFRNRVGGRSALVASGIILSTRDPSNPRPCLLGTREAKVSYSSVLQDERDTGFGTVGATAFDDCVAGFQSTPRPRVSRKPALEKSIVTNSHFLCPNGPEARV